MAKRIRWVYICDVCGAYGKPRTVDRPDVGIFKTGLLPIGWTKFGMLSLCPICTRKANNLYDTVANNLGEFYNNYASKEEVKSESK